MEVFYGDEGQLEDVPRARQLSAITLGIFGMTCSHDALQCIAG